MISEFSSLHCHSHFSLIDGIALPEEMIRATKEKTRPYKPNLKISVALKGIKRSAETKLKMSQAKKRYWAERKAKEHALADK
jgi:hypothetical protein